MDERFRTGHLVLLVGGNPLPNAVAGKLLTPQAGTVTLVHSAESFHVAERLQAWLRLSDSISEVRLKQIEESDATSIAQGVRQALEEVGKVNVGLNYTGGTKAMAVHAYRAVERWASQHQSKGTSVETVFSYLGARGLTMVVDPTDPMGGQSGHTRYVGRTIELTVKDLLALHGWTLQHEPTAQPLLPQSARALAVACADDAAFLDWRQWIQDELTPKCRRCDKDTWQSKARLGSVSLSVPPNPTLERVSQALRCELSDPSGDLTLMQSVFGNDPQHFCEWLDGKWLEHDVLGVLKNLVSSFQLHECAQNLETREVQFDVDVIALRGYQLFAFSCSTDSRKGLLKSKLFEAYIRARQLGGDEARVALVCCNDEPERLEHEMRRDVDPEGRIRVFGRRHLSDLSNKVAEWIQSQCGEEGSPPWTW